MAKSQCATQYHLNFTLINLLIIYWPWRHFVYCVPDWGVFQYCSKVSWQSRLETKNLNESSVKTQEVSLQMQESRFEFQETCVFEYSSFERVSRKQFISWVKYKQIKPFTHTVKICTEHWHLKFTCHMKFFRW